MWDVDLDLLKRIQAGVVIDRHSLLKGVSVVLGTKT